MKTILKYLFWGLTSFLFGVLISCSYRLLYCPNESIITVLFDAVIFCVYTLFFFDRQYEISF